MSLHRDRLKQEPNPFRDWKIIFSLGLIFFVIILVAEGYIYFSYIYTEPKIDIASRAGASREIIDLSKLEKVVGLINVRQLELEALLTGRPYIADPSR
jgi:hypothetical protein